MSISTTLICRMALSRFPAGKHGDRIQAARRGAAALLQRSGQSLASCSETKAALPGSQIDVEGAANGSGIGFQRGEGDIFRMIFNA